MNYHHHDLAKGVLVWVKRYGKWKGSLTFHSIHSAINPFVINTFVNIFFFFQKTNTGKQLTLTVLMESFDLKVSKYIILLWDDFCYTKSSERSWNKCIVWDFAFTFWNYSFRFSKGDKCQCVCVGLLVYFLDGDLEGLLQLYIYPWFYRGDVHCTVYMFITSNWRPLCNQGNNFPLVEAPW